jgi:hypothetical protein
VSIWNDLLPEYRRRVRTSIRVAVQNLIIGEDPTSAASVTTDATPYNAAGLVGILAEPAPVIRLLRMTLWCPQVDVAAPRARSTSGLSFPLLPWV